MPGETPGRTPTTGESAQHREEKELRYSKWLEQVTINAVEQALQFQFTESQRQKPMRQLLAVQGPSTSNRFWHFSAPKPCQSSSTNQGRWSLDRNSEERRNVAERIFAILLQWKPDLSFEWRARVASSVHIFEQAIYHEAKTKEEYLNPLMLDLQLRQVLRHFEAGTGPSLLQNQNAHSPLTKSVSFNSALAESRRQPTTAGPMPLRDLMRLQDEESSDEEIGQTPGALFVAEGDFFDLLKSDVQSSLAACERDPVSKEEADSALWEAILTGNARLLEEGLQRYKHYASKRVVKRVIGLLSKKKRAEESIAEAELRKAIGDPSVERLIAAINCARLQYGEELKDLCAKAEVALDKLLDEQERSEESTARGAPQGSRKFRRLREQAEYSLEEISSRIQVEISQTSDVEHPPSEESTQSSYLEHSGSEGLVQSYSLENHLCRQETVPVVEDSQASTSEINSCMHSLATELNKEQPSVPPNEDRGETAVGPGTSSSQPQETPSDVYQGQTRGGYAGTHIRTVSLRERRVLGSLLTEAREEHGWLPLGRTTLLDLLPSPSGISRSPIPGTNSVNSPSLVLSPGPSGDEEEHVLSPAGHAPSALTFTPMREPVNSALTFTPMREPANSALNFTPMRESMIPAVPPTETDDESQPPRVSLLTLLHQEGDPDSVFVLNRRRVQPVTCAMGWDDFSVSEEGGMDPICCVCMVDRKGAAFIPCGHTFCRKCTRELTNGRGTCPLCNRRIEDILKLF